MSRVIEIVGGDTADERERGGRAPGAARSSRRESSAATADRRLRCVSSSSRMSSRQAASLASSGRRNQFEPLRGKEPRGPGNLYRCKADAGDRSGGGGRRCGQGVTLSSYTMCMLARGDIG